MLTCHQQKNNFKIGITNKQLIPYMDPEMNESLTNAMKLKFYINKQTEEPRLLEKKKI